MISVNHVSKRYGRTVAVSDLTFGVEPGRVTAFLGRNGAGKSTTLRLLLGLDRADAGEALIGGRRYRELDRPLCTVGALLDAGAAHPARTGRNHLRWLARSNRIPRARVDEVLDLAGLTEAAGRRVGGWSLGMRQRLGLAAALLGDPQVLLLDEPTNGLDPEGIRWLRGLLRELAAQGRVVFLSSHLMAETALIADHLVVIERGRLLADEDVATFTARAALSATPESRLEEAFFALIGAAGAAGSAGAAGAAGSAGSAGAARAGGEYR